MNDPPTLLGLEVIVDDLDRAITLFTDVLGLQLVDRGPSTLIEADTAVIDAGPVAITLLAPKAHGPGRILPNREPRVSQFVFGAASTAAVDELRDGITEAGLAVAPVSDNHFFVTPESISGALGVAAAIVVVPHPAPPS